MLRLYRERHGWSRAELARRSGVARSTISEIESGNRDPRGGTLEPLAATLGTRVDDLLRTVDGEFPANAQLGDPLPEYGRTLQRERDYLGPDDLAEIDEVIVNLATARANRNRKLRQQGS